jgi:hypothetical protein
MSENLAAFSGSRSPSGEEFRRFVRPFAADSLQKQQKLSRDAREEPSQPANSL